MQPDTSQPSRGPAIKIIALGARLSPFSQHQCLLVCLLPRVCVDVCILLTRGLVVVDVDALQLQIRGATVVAQGVDSMLVGDDLPELPTRKFQSLLRVHIAFSRRFSTNSLPD